MKNHIDLLTDDELKYICDRISGKVLRDLYQKNGNEFSKLKRGFRPGSLTDEETYNFACANRNTPFIADFLNIIVDRWLQEIDDAKEKAMKDGLAEKVAIIETLANSYFDERPSLYFKIRKINQPIDDEFLCYAVKLASERDHMLSADEDIDNQLKQLRHTIESEAQKKCEEYERALKVAKQEMKKLQADVEQYRMKLNSSESIRTALEKELKTYRELAALAVEEEEMKPTQGFHYASLCVSYVDDFGRDRLLRVADVREGEFSDIFIESAPEYTRLYRHGGPTSEGTIGVWDWRVIPNRNDPTKDYIESSFNEIIKPIEVIISKGCISIEDIVDLLRKGYSVDLHAERVLFSILNGGKYDGIYCDSKVLEYKSGIATLKEDVLKLPVYTFSKIDTLFLEGINVLNIVSLGMPQRLARVKDPMDTVRDCIISKATWPVTQQKGFTRSEYQRIKAFLTELQTNDLYEEISKKCDCSLDEAIEYVTAFMNRADKIALGDTVENDVMVQIIKNDPDAYAGCMSELRKVWEQENASIIAEASASLEAVRKEEARCRKNVENKEQELSELQKKISETKQELESQKNMAEEVERLVFQKIEHAKNHAAEFIANSAFVHAVGNVPVTNNAVQVNTSEENRTLFTASEAINSDEPDENDTYSQLLQTVQFELGEAGVAEEYTTSLASLLYGAYVRRIPILLAGPNGQEIANAFAAGMDAKTAAIFTCIINEKNGIDQCESSDDDIIVIENPLQAYWENNVIRLISKRKKFYILTQPFADDLVLEPRGLLNYCLPVLTELFVSGTPTRNYAGGKMSESFKHYVPESISGRYCKILDELKITSLARENVQALITDIGKLTKRDEADDVLQLLLYPLAYAIGEQHTLIEKVELMDIKPSMRIIAKLKRLIGEEE